MKLQTVLELPECRVLVKGDPEREISKVFCCDLLSIAMGKAPPAASGSLSWGTKIPSP